MAVSGPGGDAFGVWDRALGGNATGRIIDAANVDAKESRRRRLKVLHSSGDASDVLSDRIATIVVSILGDQFACTGVSSRHGGKVQLIRSATRMIQNSSTAMHAHWFVHRIP